MAVWVHCEGSWKGVQNGYVNVSGTWKTMQNIWIRVASVWKPAWSYAYEYGDWSACSAGCGGGTQTRSARCRRSDGVYVDDTFCTAAGVGKEAVSASCNTTACFSSAGYDRSVAFTVPHDGVYGFWLHGGGGGGGGGGHTVNICCTGYSSEYGDLTQHVQAKGGGGGGGGSGYSGYHGDTFLAAGQVLYVNVGGGGGGGAAGNWGGGGGQSSITGAMNAGPVGGGGGGAPGQTCSTACYQCNYQERPSCTAYGGAGGSGGVNGSAGGTAVNNKQPGAAAGGGAPGYNDNVRHGGWGGGSGAAGASGWSGYVSIHLLRA